MPRFDSPSVFGSMLGRHATARDIMTANAECISVNDTLVDAARKLRDLDVGAMPICDADDRLKGMLTDRGSPPLR